MSDINIKQLLNEVQLLRDELAIMKRKYEDIIYNLDDDNFSSRFVKEKGDMRTAIEINAEGIKTKVSNEEFQSSIEQTASKIETEVAKIQESTNNTLKEYSNTKQTASMISAEVAKLQQTTDEKLTNYATIEMTNESIQSSVVESKTYTANELKKYSTTDETEQYVTDTLADGGYITSATFQSHFDQYADGIYSTVESTYETKDDASSSYSSLRGSISSISQKADSISTKVGQVENGEFKGYTLFTQTQDKFAFTGNVEIISKDDSDNIIKLGEGHMQLIPCEDSNSIVDLGMYNINSSWQPRMRFGQGTGVGNNGQGWIYKTLNGFGMLYNTDLGKTLSIEFSSLLNAIYISGNVVFDGGTVEGLPASGAVFG